MTFPTLHSGDELYPRTQGPRVTTPSFSRSELATAFEKFEETVARAAETRDWDAWVAQYTPDVEYIEHAAGTMRGREQVRAWIEQTMTTFPGSHMVAFPTLWSVIDGPTGRVILELDNPMRDPGDGTVISATNISIITYAGDGQWCREEDIYNPLRFLRAGLKWCRKAQALGTLDEDAARWMEENGGGSK
jgi:ketosteroid isomerase-like protein